MNLTDIARQHPQSVAFCFSQFGHPVMPVSAKNLAAMIVAHDEPFITELANTICAECSYSGYDSYDRQNNNPRTYKVVTKRQKNNNAKSNVSQPMTQTEWDAAAEIRNKRQTVHGPVSISRNNDALTPDTLTEFHQISQPPVFNVPVSTPSLVAPKKSFWQHLVTGVKDITGIVNGIKQANTVTPETILKAEQQKKNKNMLWIALAVIGVLIIGLVIVNSKGKKTIK